MNEEYLRSVVFGLEDSLVSTTGVVVGIAAGTSSRDFILLAGFVTIAVEAISMAAGQFLTERTIHQYDHLKHKDSLIKGSVLMFFSYFIGGMVPLTPILLFNHSIASYLSVAAAGTGLFVLGYVKGKVVKTSPTRSALEMLFIGGTACIVGVLAGFFLKI